MYTKDQIERAFHQLTGLSNLPADGFYIADDAAMVMHGLKETSEEIHFIATKAAYSALNTHHGKETTLTTRIHLSLPPSLFATVMKAPNYLGDVQVPAVEIDGCMVMSKRSLMRREISMIGRFALLHNRTPKESEVEGNLMLLIG